MNDAAIALRALASYQRDHADFGFVVSTPRVLTPAEMSERAAEVRQIAGELEALADKAKERRVTYDEFDTLRARFQPLGKLPPSELVSNVARSITAAELGRLDQTGQRAG